MAPTKIGSQVHTAEISADGRTWAARSKLVARIGHFSAFCDGLSDSQNPQLLRIAKRL
ncbi:hypothetical protein FrEUN1fDRAFT_3128 [Parafrankia sp. EUN1f]|nr:hypothetical protein FrEUN1fDRAFT_3128 [Parafrankia sp. EUN1f]